VPGMKIVSVVGARPQFIKAAMVSRALAAAGLSETIVHTGQHYDQNMSKVFFDELDIRRPDHDLEVGSGTHAYQTGETMKRLEAICLSNAFDAMVVYGDTNATLAGALVGAKCNIPVAHVEAGLRSFDRSMPEEVNRVVCDHLSQWLFCPTAVSVDNLAKEGITAGVHHTGDVMYDAALHFREAAAEVRGELLDRFSVRDRAFTLVTIHRDFNADDRGRLEGIVGGLLALGEDIVFPAHPRVRKQIERFGLADSLEGADHVRLVEPLSYIEMVCLEICARVILTDSGGVQKEAYFHRTPCVTVRSSTEWVETVEAGWNRLVEAAVGDIAGAVDQASPPAGGGAGSFYGDGQSAPHIAAILGGGTGFAN
jgi:UDP-GlcNAc3NAcA epimerase